MVFLRVLVLQANIDKEYGLLCDLLHETRNCLIWATSERDVREVLLSYSSRVQRTRRPQRIRLFPRALVLDRSRFPTFVIEEDMLLSALSHICVYEKGGASFKEFGPLSLPAVDLVPISLRIHC